MTSRRISSWLLVVVVMVGADRRGGARDGGGIGRGELDGIERLSVLMSGDRGPADEQVVKFDGTDSVNEGGGTFSWFDKGSVVGNGVLGLMNTGVEGEAIDVFFVVVYVGSESWSGWMWLGRKGHEGFSSSWRVLILLAFD